MGVPVLALFRENKIRESQYYCYSRNLNPLKFMPYTVCWRYSQTASPTYFSLSFSRLRYGAAEQDCSLALALDSSYIKAWLRRATVRALLNKLQPAIDGTLYITTTTRVSTIVKTLRTK